METFRRLLLTSKLIHVAIFLSMIIFFAIALYFKTQHLFAPGAQLKQYLLVLVPLVAIAGITAANMLFKTKMDSLQTDDSFDKKLAVWRQAFIIKCALVEAPVLFSLVALMLTSDKLFAIIATLLLGYFISLFPSKEKIADNLPLAPHEKNDIFTA